MLPQSFEQTRNHRDRMMEFGRPAKRKNTEKAGPKITTRGRAYLLRTGSEVGGSLLSGECFVIMSAQRDVCVIFFEGLFWPWPVAHR